MKYKVVRYFDTYPDGVVGVYETKAEAQREACELNAKEKRPHVDYMVRPENE